MRDLIVYLILYSTVVMPLPDLFKDTADFYIYSALYKSYMKFKEAVQLLLKSNFTKEDLDKAQLLFEIVFRYVQDLGMGIHMNWHNSLHLCKIVSFFGNLRNYWMFFYERMYKNMKATKTNGRTVAKTLLKDMYCSFKAAQLPKAPHLSTLFTRKQDVYVAAPGFTMRTHKAQQRRKDDEFNKLVRRINDHKADKDKAWLSALDALRLQVDHPNLRSCSILIEQALNTKEGILHWFGRATWNLPFSHPFATDRRLSANLRFYLSQRVFTDKNLHLTIREVSQARVVTINGVTCETRRESTGSQSATKSIHTSHVRVLRPATNSTNIAEIRLFLQVQVNLQTVATEHQENCTCHSKEGTVCEYEPPRPDPNQPLHWRNLYIAVVDHLKTFAEYHVAYRDLTHPSGNALSSLDPHHEYNRDLANTVPEGMRLQRENDEGDHFIAQHRILEGVTLMEQTLPHKPTFYLVLPHPKGI